MPSPQEEGGPPHCSTRPSAATRSPPVTRGLPARTPLTRGVAGRVALRLLSLSLALSGPPVSHESVLPSVSVAEGYSVTWLDHSSLVPPQQADGWWLPTFSCGEVRCREHRGSSRAWVLGAGRAQLLGRPCRRGGGPGPRRGPPGGRALVLPRPRRVGAGCRLAVV